MQEQKEFTLESNKVIAYRPELARYLESVEAAIYFQQLCHWQQYAVRPDGFVFKSAKEIEEETMISPRKQRSIRSQLEELGWIEIKKEMAKGAPTLHFKVLVSVNTMIRFVTTTNGLLPSDKSITKSTTKKDNITSEILEQVNKIYHGYLIKFVVDPDAWAYGSAQDREVLLTRAEKKYKLTDKRKLAVARRLEDCGFQMCKDAVINCSKSAFHRGDDPNSNGWFAHLDWIMKSYEKVEEWSNRKVEE